MTFLTVALGVALLLFFLRRFQTTILMLGLLGVIASAARLMSKHTVHKHDGDHAQQTVHKQTHDAGRSYVAKHDGGVYGQMTQSEQLAAQFAKAAYEGVDARKNIGGFTYDRSMSSDDFASYYNATTGDSYAAHRGTAGMKDVLQTWLPLGLGAENYTSRFKRSKQKGTAHLAKHASSGRGRHIVTGHSMAGSLARESMKDQSNKWDRAVTFDESSWINPKGLIAGGRCALGGPAWCRKMTRVRAGGDAVSAQGRHGYGAKTYHPRGKHKPWTFVGAHAVDLFLPSTAPTVR